MTRSRLVLWGVLAALVATTLPLLLRDIWIIPQHVPLDPNEGWNAAHALRLNQLYPSPGGWMINNYPPLSFYLAAVIAHITGDAVVAGRVISLLSFAAAAIAIATASRLMGTGRRAACAAALFFAAVLLVASDYVAMDDPQLLGHAIQLGGLLLALRGRSLPAALLFAVALFVKHNLLALPVATGLWLCTQNRRAGLTFITTGLVACGAGLLAFHAAFGTSLLAQLASPRLSSLTNITVALRGLWWAPLPALAIIAIAPGRARSFVLIYGVAALALGLVFSAGDGVDANAFFDLAIALSLALGLAVDRKPLFALAALAPAIFLALHFHDNNYFYTRDFAQQSARDIAFVRTQPGPALCDQLSLCQWAGKTAQVDVFNVGEAIRTGARDPAPLVRAIAQHRFGVIQLQDLDALGPQVRGSIAAHYRVHHTNDNGSFLTPAP
jgi:hypothetical protein